MSRLLAIAFTPAEAASLAGFAQALGTPFDLLMAVGTDAHSVGQEKTLGWGADSLPLAEALAPSLSQLATEYTHLAALSSMKAKDILARAAGLADAAMVTDVLGVQSETLFTRPMVAGSIIAQVEVAALPVFLTFRPAGFAKVEAEGTVSVETLGGLVESPSTLVSRSDRSGQARPDLVQASVVVSGGRPLGDAETFERVIGGLADKLGGAVGATRAAVDSGIAPNELQVGQTGKVVAPGLYIAAGISGSTQHMAGIKDSKIIVAINKDREAPIFDSADLGLVADLFDAIPELMKKL